MKIKRRPNQRRTVTPRSRMMLRLNKEMRSLRKWGWYLTFTYLTQPQKRLNQRG